MAKSKKITPSSTTEELIKDLLILELGSIGVPQAKIREIVGVDMLRVSRIVKHIPKNKNES